VDYVDTMGRYDYRCEQWPVDLENLLLHVATKKTGKRVVLPMHGDLAIWLSQRPRGIGKAPIFPSLACQPLNGGSGLSAQFRAIVARAGIVGRVVTRQGKGRSTNSKTFHGLRHSFISQLANAGVAPEIRQKLAGHASAERKPNWKRAGNETPFSL
jgi:integrase